MDAGASGYRSTPRAVTNFGPRRNCTHHKPDACHETGAVGCRCGASRRIKLFEVDKICEDFADELGNAGFHIFFHRRPKFLRYFIVLIDF